MKKPISSIAVFCALILAVLLTGCGSSVPRTQNTTSSTSPSLGGTIDGAALYNNYCSGCHGPLASSSKLGATPAMIQTAIASNFGGMGQFSNLTADQILAISVALGGATPSPTSTPTPTTTPTPTPVSTDGATLYATYCAGCHGPLATSSKLGATAAMIQTGISTVGAMSGLSTLTTAQIDAIAAALSTGATTTTPLPTDGATLYSNYCSVCHGPLSQSSVGGATASQIQAQISANTGGMGQFSTLTAAQIQAIANALATVP